MQRANKYKFVQIVLPSPPNWQSTTNGPSHVASCDLSETHAVPAALLKLT